MMLTQTGGVITNAQKTRLKSARCCGRLYLHKQQRSSGKTNEQMLVTPTVYRKRLLVIHTYIHTYEYY